MSPDGEVSAYKKKTPFRESFPVGARGFASSRAGETSAYNAEDPPARIFQSGREDLHRPVLGKRPPIMQKTLLRGSSSRGERI